MATVAPENTAPLWTRLERAVQAFQSELQRSSDSHRARQVMAETLTRESRWRQAWIVPPPSGATPATGSSSGWETAGTTPFPREIMLASHLSPGKSALEAGYWQVPLGQEVWYRFQPIIASQEILGWAICQTQGPASTSPPADEAEMMWAWSEWLAEDLRKERQRNEQRRSSLRAELRAVEITTESLSTQQRRSQYAQLLANIVQVRRVVAVRVKPKSRAQLVAVSDATTWDRRAAWCDSLEKASVALVEPVRAAGHPPETASQPDQEARSPSPTEPQALPRLRSLDLSGLGSLLPTDAMACVSVELESGSSWLWWFFDSQERRFNPAAQLEEALIDITLRLRSEIQRIEGTSTAIARWILGHSPARRIGIAALLLAVLAFFPIPLRIVVQGELQPTEQRRLFAPEASRIVALGPVDGQSFTAGTELVTLVDDRLDEEWTELTGTLESLNAEQRSIESRLASLSPFDAESVSETERLRSRAALIEVQRRGIEARSEVLARQRSALHIKAPIDGRVISAEARRRLAERPVKRGESLLVIANPSGRWEARLKVDPLDWSELARQLEYRNQSGKTLSASLSIDAFHRHQFHGSVSHFSGVPVFDPEGTVTGTLIVPLSDKVPENLPAGTRATAWVDCGRQPACYVLFRRFLTWSRWNGWI